MVFHRVFSEESRKLVDSSIPAYETCLRGGQAHTRAGLRPRQTRSDALILTCSYEVLYLEVLSPLRRCCRYNSIPLAVTRAVAAQRFPGPGHWVLISRNCPGDLLSYGHLLRVAVLSLQNLRYRTLGSDSRLTTQDSRLLNEVF
jgi:hypothetical protein